MGHVSEFLLKKIEKQVDQWGVVVWLDPLGQYQEIFRSINIVNLHKAIVQKEQGFLSLRRNLEQAFSQSERPRLLIYIPYANDETESALVEYIAAGVVIQPEGQPAERNTRLSFITREAVGDSIPLAKLSKMIEDIDQGLISLIEVDDQIQHHKQVQIGVLAVIFKTEVSEDIALLFIADEKIDSELLKRNALTNLINLLESDYGLSYSGIQNPQELRAAFIRSLLTTEFLITLSGDGIPLKLNSIKLPAEQLNKNNIIHLVNSWRQRQDLVNLFIKSSQDVESRLDIKSIPWNISQIKNSQTFSSIESIQQQLIETQLLGDSQEDCLAYIQEKQNHFWAKQDPNHHLHWQIIEECAQILNESKKILAQLNIGASSEQMVTSYTDFHNGWCQLDTIYRRLERDEHTFDFEVEDHDSLRCLTAKARRTYQDVLHRMNELFTNALEQAKFNWTSSIRQIQVFHDFIQPSLEEGRTAFILVDALRYEMGAELANLLDTHFNIKLYPVVATPPTITAVGMAALLPDAEKDLALIADDKNSLNIEINGIKVRNREERLKFLKEKCNSQTVIADLSQLAPLKDKNLRNQAQQAGFMVVTTSDAIDGLWETNPNLARRLHEDIFSQLRRTINSLLNLGFQNIIITSDHGFIAGEDLMVGVPTEAPGGNTIELHRRVWIGYGGTLLPSCLRTPVSVFGIRSDLELVTPKGLGWFKTPGGSSQYFHGGLSMQELIIPLLIIHSGKTQTESRKVEFNWVLTLGSQQITTRFFSITLAGSSGSLLEKPPRIRVELRAGDQTVSVPVSASYGFDETTRDVQMQLESQGGTLVSNTITLSIFEVPSVSKLDLHILDSETGFALIQQPNIPFKISF